MKDNISSCILTIITVFLCTCICKCFFKYICLCIACLNVVLPRANTLSVLITLMKSGLFFTLLTLKPPDCLKIPRHILSPCVMLCHPLKKSASHLYTPKYYQCIPLYNIWSTHSIWTNIAGFFCTPLINSITPMF